MVWLNDPQEDPIIGPRNFCVIRVCSNKGYCNGYTCVLACNKNK